MLFALFFALSAFQAAAAEGEKVRTLVVHVPQDDPKSWKQALAWSRPPGLALWPRLMTTMCLERPLIMKNVKIEK